MPAHVDPTAIVESGAILGEGVQVWQFSKIRKDARIGRGSKIGGNAYVGAGVVVGENVKIENGAQIFEGSALGDGVFVGPNVLLTNDRFPRAVTPSGSLKKSTDWVVQGVTVEEGASIGAGAIVLPGVTVGAWALIGAGSLVSRPVDPFRLVIGRPAKVEGWVCRCARPLRETDECVECGFSPSTIQ